MKHPILLASISLFAALTVVDSADARVIDTPTTRMPTATTTAPVVNKPTRRTIRERVKATARTQEGRYPTVSTAVLDQKYENADLRLQMLYPRGWERNDLHERTDTLELVVMFLSPRKEMTMGVRTNINLVTEKISTSMTLEEYTKFGIENEKLFFESFEIKKQQRVMLNRYPTHQIDFVASSQGTTLAYRQVWFLKNGTAFVWTFADHPSMFDKNLYIFERMMDAVRID
jgi:hypothetical protein